MPSCNTAAGEAAPAAPGQLPRHLPRTAGDLYRRCPLPTLPGLYWGDLHTHSNYTEDQIEFGAPLPETACCARALGLHFIAVTDHSYDMDNLPGDYTRNDPELRKWRQFRAEVAHLNRELDGFIILPGEEVSVGNQRRQNVHCLVLGSGDFYPGAGDSGDRPLFNRPTLALPELYARVQASGNGAVIAAAHPREVPPAPTAGSSTAATGAKRTWPIPRWISGRSSTAGSMPPSATVTGPGSPHCCPARKWASSAAPMPTAISTIFAS